MEKYKNRLGIKTGPKKVKLLHNNASFSPVEFQRKNIVNIHTAVLMVNKVKVIFVSFLRFFKKTTTAITKVPTKENICKAFTIIKLFCRRTNYCLI